MRKTATPAYNIHLLDQTQIKIHTHTHTLGQGFIMSGDFRERSGHGAGRQQYSPTRTCDPESSLMGSGGAVVDTGSTHGGVGSATDSNYGSVVAAGQHQFMGSGSGYNFRHGQPRQLQGQLVQIKDVGADEIDGQGVGGTSGSDVDDLDTTLEGDDPVGMGHSASSLMGGDITAPEQRHSSLVGGTQVTMERQRSNLAGDYSSVVAEEQQRQAASVATQHSGESTTGFKPHSPHVPADGSCFTFSQL